MASSGDQSFSSHFPGLVEHQDSKDFWLCIAIWPAAPGTLPVLLTGPQAGSDALQSKWAMGPWSDSTLAVLGILELLVPQAVDEGVHCWRNHRVENSHHQIQGCGGDGEGLQVGNHASTDKQGDHSQEGPIVQRFADGQVTIICHYCEERILCCGQEEEEKDLYNTSCIGDIPGVPQGIGHGFGDSGGDGAQVEEGKVEEEEVHGGVEAVVAGYGGDDEAIAQEGSQVDAQEEPEVQELQLPCVRKCQEEELGDGAAVGHLLPLGVEH
ncbi:hypothetical protein QYF61_006963 [Mycteria americana]|uniref:Uncharacterized protein n=1 Tax=Mycteria americana TaxID=33587 RepID=A0AAN7N7H7_MYCAM|nr:hypothetical protein QYF61_006963 [Mycteria americana]